MFEETGCAGIMIGRGAVRNPWLPLQVQRGLQGLPVPSPTRQERRDFLLAYLALEKKRFYTEAGALGRLKKFVGYYTHGVPGGSALRVAVLHDHTLAEAEDHIHAFFDAI